MKYFIFILLFGLQVLSANTLVLPRQISVPAGTVVVGASTGVGTTTPAGTTGQYLQSNGTSTPPTWSTPYTNPMTTGGDIIYGGASGVATRLPNGTSGQVLKSNGGTAAPSWGSGSAYPTSGDIVTYGAIIVCNTGGSSVTNNYGLIASIATRGSFGCVVTINSGLFSTTPACSITAASNALPSGMDYTSATSVTPYVTNLSGTFLNYTGALICTGLKP